MPLFNTPEKFGLLLRLYHWAIALFVGLQFALVYRRNYLPDAAPEKLQYLLWHKSLGIFVLLLVCLMLIVRKLGKRPAFPHTMRSWEKKVARLTHAALYVSLLIMPLTGYLMSTFKGYPVSFFGWLTLPKLVALNEPYALLAKQIHEVTSFLLLGLVGLHILAALKHHVVDKDAVLRRML